MNISFIFFIDIIKIDKLYLYKINNLIILNMNLKNESILTNDSYAIFPINY